MYTSRKLTSIRKEFVGRQERSEERMSEVRGAREAGDEALPIFTRVDEASCEYLVNVSRLDNPPYIGLQHM